MWFGRLAIKVFGPILRGIFRVRVVGEENIRSAAAPLMLCCNHLSLWDPVLLEIAHPQRHVYFMAKQELFRSPVLRWLLGKQFGAFPVHRGTGDTGAVRTAQEIVQSGKLLGIFPEGTRSKTGKLLNGKAGAAWIAAKTGAAVLPAVLVTRCHHIRAFSPTVLVYGKPLTTAELHLDGEKPDIRFATRRIMETLSDMITATRHAEGWAC